MFEMIDVLLVDDHSLIREGLGGLINAQPDMRVVASAETSREALALVREHKPDIVVLDIMLPDFSGLDTIPQMLRIAESAPTGGDAKSGDDTSPERRKNLAIVILSMYDNENAVYHALRAGATSYVTKSSPSEEVLLAIRRAYVGQSYLSPSVADFVIGKFLRSKGDDHADSLYNLLSEREQEVFRLVVEGHSNAQIADFLSISPKTVEKHRANLMAKLNVHSFRELLRIAVQIGLIEVQSE